MAGPIYTSWRQRCPKCRSRRWTWDESEPRFELLKQRKCVECGMVYFPPEVPGNRGWIMNPGCLFCLAFVMFVMSLIDAVGATFDAGADRIGKLGDAALRMLLAIGFVYFGVRLARRLDQLVESRADSRRTSPDPALMTNPSKSPSAVTEATAEEPTFTFHCQQ